MRLSDGTEYLCEMQLNLQQMLDAKKEAHTDYEVIRTELPKLCKASGVSTEVVMDDDEAVKLLESIFNDNRYGEGEEDNSQRPEAEVDTPQEGGGEDSGSSRCRRP